MNHPVSDRVGAFIIRKNSQNLYELLLFKQEDRESVQIPGGSIELGESIEVALQREIYEESGLTNLSLVRKLGITERCWLDSHVVVCRHCFLLEAPTTTADAWDYIVQGSGADAGLCFSYFWYRPDLNFTLPSRGQIFLNPHDIPELYS